MSRELHRGPIDTTGDYLVYQLLAVFLAIQTFAKNYRDMTILIQTDNVPIMSYINQRGSTHLPSPHSWPKQPGPGAWKETLSSKSST